MRTEEQKARRQERKWIEKFPDKPWPGYTIPKEQRDKISKGGKEYYKDPVARQRNQDLQKESHNTVETRQRCSEAQKKVQGTPEAKQRNSEAVKKHHQEHPETGEKMSQSIKKHHEDPKFRQRMSEMGKKRYEDPEERIKTSKQMTSIMEAPEARQRVAEIQKKRYEDPEEHLKTSKAVKKHYDEVPDSRKRSSEAQKKHHAENPETAKKISRSVIKTWLDKQWYGVVTYALGRIYCVLFNDEFKERCRAYWRYKSVLEPHKTQAENICGGKPYKLTVHHVYYQPKACCEWDEDLEGYYAMINLGTERKPNMVRHNIKGDPNKFVILTAAEHNEIKSDKLVWIKKFEDMIEEQGGKCYLTKEEMKAYVPTKI
jgi:hypothetical protein